MEYFDEDKNLRIDQDARVRIHGGGTRQNSQKSLRLYAKGSVAKFYFPLFPQKPYHQYDRVILRNGGNDRRGVFFRDAFTQLLTQHLNVTTQGYKPVVVFLNGEYWGLHELRERYDDEYFKYHYGVPKDSIDILENNMAVEDGDSLHYLNLINYLKSSDITQPEVYNYVTTQMDIENYIDYVIVEVYTDNGDWPGNNSMFWRKRTTGYQPNAPYGHDGRWRWSLQDLDFSFGLYNSKSYTTRTLEIATEPGGNQWPNPDWSTFLLRTLMKNHTFARAFHIRFADQINTTFIPERVISLVDSVEQLLDYDMTEQIARWRNPTSKDIWYAEIDTIRTWAALRPENMRSQLAGYFSLPGMYTFTCNINLPQSATLKVNTIDIDEQTAGIPNPQQPFPWTGTYFLQVPLTIKAQARPGYSFKYWQIENEQITNNPFTFTPRADVYVEAIFEKWPVNNPKVSDLSLRIWPNPATEQIQIDLSAFAGQKVNITLYNVTGQPVEQLYNGMISDLDRSKTFSLLQLPAGVYLVVISTPAYRQTIKLIKNKT